MIKKTKTKTFDTDTATVVKKVCFGEFGDPAGYPLHERRRGIPLQGGEHHVLLQIQGSCLDREQLSFRREKSGQACLLFFIFWGKGRGQTGTGEKHERRGGACAGGSRVDNPFGLPRTSRRLARGERTAVFVDGLTKMRRLPQSCCRHLPDNRTAPSGRSLSCGIFRSRKRLLTTYTGEVIMRFVNNPSVRLLPRLTPSRAVETALGQEMARSMCHFQARKWSTPHRGVDKKAFARPLHRGG